MAVTASSKSGEKMLSVVNQESEPVISGQRLPRLLRSPDCRWVWGNVVMQDRASSQIHDHEDVQGSECRGDHYEEVARSDDLGVITNPGSAGRHLMGCLIFRRVWISIARIGESLSMPDQSVQLHNR